MTEMEDEGAGANVRYFDLEVDGENLKALSAALHFLQKIGKETTIEMERDSFTLRALNDNKSAFASVELGRNFFESFLIDSPAPSFACKVVIKPICVLFRNTKHVKQVRISATRAGAEHALCFEFLARSSISRMYRFRYADCDVVNAVFDEEAERCSAVRAKPKVFSQLMAHIHQSPEVCIEAAADAFAVRSYHHALSNSSSSGGIGGGRGSSSSNAVQRRYVRTGLSVNLQEFDSYEFRAIDGDEQHVQEIIFCSKEVTSFLGFCEVVDSPDFELFFTESARALKVQTKHDSLAVTATLVLATIEPPPALASMEDMMAQTEQLPPAAAATENGRVRSSNGRIDNNTTAEEAAVAAPEYEAGESPPYQEQERDETGDDAEEDCVVQRKRKRNSGKSAFLQEAGDEDRENTTNQQEQNQQQNPNRRSNR